MKQIDLMTDLEFVDHYIVRCRSFVNPGLLREASKRGLVRYLDFLPTDIHEAKSVVRARLSSAGKCFGDDEIDKIAGAISRLEYLRKELNELNLADAHKVIPVLNQMQAHSLFVKDYFKSNTLPN